MFQNIKKRAFTLAETLVTLGIIGVLAAMTIPNLVTNTTGAKYRSSFKKTLTTLNQAALMTQVQYDLDYSTVSAYCNDDEVGHPDVDDSVCGLLGAALTGYSYLKMNRLSTPSGVPYAVNGPVGVQVAVRDYLFLLPDGVIVFIPDEMVNCTLPVGTHLTKDILTTYAGLGAAEGDIGLRQCLAYVDVNGVNPPNREVTCSNGVDTDFTPETPCEVRNNNTDLSDVYPIVFHDTVVEPATNASKYVLMSGK